ncbi:hypothetical protein C1645_817802 [Glomus cerebriforme]|uniref:Uncharacterized protein n=1 Tax=Glomus cerebriforme TaxID=658196 RepID=A0A397T8I3_9GLOM|nr:hypothetical protein C1645_817802 [Glomus cerebriforme]
MKCLRHLKTTCPYVSIPKLRVRAINKPQYDKNKESSILEHNDIEGITFENEQVYYKNYQDNDDDDDEDQLLPQILQVDDDDDDDTDNDDDDDQLLYRLLLAWNFTTTSAYKDLAKILTHLEFQKEDISTNIYQILRGVVADEMNNNTLKLKIDQLLSHKNLPNCHSTDNWHSRGNEPKEYNFYIQEIVYRFNGRWKYHNITMRHQLPCEYITLTSLLLQQGHVFATWEYATVFLKATQKLFFNWFHSI